ncbi:MAG: cytochrome c3 family protein [Desulfuromonadaceae bacterium]|nr:cytochrome c3 family protein [Desulfuromonadaceae bacterium]MDD4131062.1 cytochrome c3 family protein [Desulfuromonadaceae bacterium]
MNNLIFCTVTSLFFMAGSLHAATFSVLSPANNSFVEHEQLSIVLSLQGGGTTAVKALVNGTTFTKAVPEGGHNNIVCLGVTLVNGLNKIDISTTNPSGAVSTGKLSIYLRSRLSKQHQQPPPGFQRYYFHVPANESACTPCHRMEATLNDMHPVKPEDSPCYQCHKRKDNRTYKHKPVSAWACFSCHEVVTGKRKYTTMKPEQSICFLCHSNQQKLWKNKKVHHGPTAVGNCSVCHDPHGSNWPSLVYMHPTDLCLNCHNDKKSGLHVIAGFFAKGHPVRGDKNPLKPDRPFSCAGCHNPHAGDSQSLLNKERDNNSVYCQTCHKL